MTEAARSVGRYRARHSRRRARSKAHKALVAANVGVAVALVASASAFGYAQWRLGQIRRVHVHELTRVGRGPQSGATTPGQKPSPTGPPMTILIVGSDSRAALQGTSSAKQYGTTAQVGGARSDTIILARLVPATKQITLLSIPRDLWVPIAGMGHQKINAAIGVSPDLLIQTIQTQLGIDVNHYVDVDFQSFKDIASAVGGVQVYFPTKARDFFSNLVVPSAGCTTLAGDQALAFVRSREYQYYQNGYWQQESLSDLARIQRQQIFVRKMVKKAEAVGLSNPLEINSIIGGVTRNLTVDDTLSTAAMISLAQTFRGVNADGIQGLTLPTYGVTLPGPNDVLMPQPAQDKAMIATFLDSGQAAAAVAGTPTTSPALPVLGTTTTTTTSVPGFGTSSSIAASSIAVRVDNGSGVARQAGQAASDLRQAGFSVVGIGTAPSYGYSSSVVEYGSGYSDSARSLAARIGGGATVEQISGLGSTVVLITGRSYSGVVAGTGVIVGNTPTTAAASTTAPSTSTSTTVPATTTTTYALPGTTPGAPQATCS